MDTGATREDSTAATGARPGPPTVDRPSAPRSETLRIGKLPHPGVPRPQVAWPTVALFVVTLAVWVTSSAAAITAAAPRWLTIGLNATASFVMFTVLHDAAHRGLGSKRWVNEVLGRLAVPFVVLYASFPMFRHIHLTHHRFVNEGPDVDPDDWISHGPTWQLPLRWLVVDLWYAQFYLRGIRKRPAKEVRETVLVALAALALVAAVTATGHLATFLIVYFVPHRIALFVLAWWFDWLPHHGLEATFREDRFRSTRNIIGGERVLTPLLLSQNYHLVHHLHPIVPFYRYVQAWRNNEEAYLEHDPALATISGRELDADDYRALRGLARPAASVERPG